MITVFCGGREDIKKRDERERERDRDTETDRQRHRETETKRDRDKERQTQRQIGISGQFERQDHRAKKAHSISYKG